VCRVTDILAVLKSRVNKTDFGGGLPARDPSVSVSTGRTDPFDQPSRSWGPPPCNVNTYRHQPCLAYRSHRGSVKHSQASVMSFGSRRPTQQLNIACNDCGTITVRFESFVADGAIFEMVGTKLSEMMAFLSASPELVRCTACTERAVADSEYRRQQERDRIRRQMEVQPLSPGPHDQPAMYGQSSAHDSDGNRNQARNYRVGDTPSPLRRAKTQRDQGTTSR
jgi:hypothetical protein